MADRSRGRMIQPPETPNYSKTLSKKLSTIYKELCQRENAERAIFLEYDDLKIAGIRSGLKSNFDFQKFRSELLSMLQTEDKSPIVQVVGDSGQSFSEPGIKRSLKTLSSHITNTCVIEYGFTASRGDANWIVNQYISENQELSSRTIGSVVGQSIGVFGRDKWQAMEGVKNMVVLYNEDSTLTRFGDDTWVSDELMSGSFGDKMICLEGGLQSLRQAVNVLCADVPVVTCTGLRNVRGRFSAAALLQVLARSHVSNIEDAKHAFDQYVLHGKPRNEMQKQSIWDEVERLLSSVGSKLDKLVLTG